MSARGIQIGYLSAERCGWIGCLLVAGNDIQTVFQEKTSYRALIRISLNANGPDLPPERIAPDPEPDWGPDEIAPDY